MRIALVIPEIHKQGGTERYMAELAEHLGRRHEVTVFTSRAADLDPAGRRLTVRRVPMLRRPAALRYASFFVMNSLVRALANERFDIVHCTGADVWAPDVATAQVCQAGRRAALRRYREGPPRTALDALRRLNFWASLRLTEGMERLIFSPRRTRLVISVSEKVRGEIAELCGRPYDAIEVIPNGVEPARFHPDNVERFRRAMRAEIGVPEDAFLVLFLGGDWRHKGVATLLTAVARLRDRRLWLALVGPAGRDRPFFERMAADQGIADRVVIRPPTREPERSYAAADVFVHPTYYDSFAMAPLEAMATGIPAVVSSQAGLSEWIVPGENGLVLENPDDAAELAGHLARLRDDPAARARMGRAARSTAEAFSWDRIAERTEALYRRLCDGRA